MGGVDRVVGMSLALCVCVAMDEWNVSVVLRLCTLLPRQLLVECLVVEVQQHYRICNQYASPGGTLAIDRVLDVLTQPPYGCDIIAGDFNARDASWSQGFRMSTVDAFARGARLKSWCYARGFSRSNNGIPYRPSTHVYSAVVPTDPLPATAKCADLLNPPGNHYLVILDVPESCWKILRRQRRVLWWRVTPAHRAIFCGRLLGAACVSDLQKRLGSGLTHLPRGSLRLQLPTTLTLTPTAAVRSRIRCADLGATSSTHRVHHALLCALLTPRQTPHMFPPAQEWQHSTDSSLARPLPTCKQAQPKDDMGLPSRLLKWCSAPLLGTLPSLFTDTLRRSHRLPASWRRCTFVPLWKEGKNPRLLTSYRPVAITSLVCRLLERILSIHPLASLGKPLSQHPFGCCPGRSTPNAIGHIIGSAMCVLGRWPNHVPGSSKRSAPYSKGGKVPCRVSRSVERLLSHPSHDTEMDTPLSRRHAPRYLIEFVRSVVAVWSNSHDVFVRSPLHGSLSVLVFRKAPSLGSLLFAVFIDDLLLQLESAVPRRAFIGASGFMLFWLLMLMTSRYLLVVSTMDPIILRAMQDLVQNNMLLSSKKSVFQWLWGSHCGPVTYLRRRSIASRTQSAATTTAGSTTVAASPDTLASVEMPPIEVLPFPRREHLMLYGLPVLLLSATNPRAFNLGIPHHCERRFPSAHGGAVHHVLTCRNLSSLSSQDTLWGNSSKKLLQVRKQALQYVNRDDSDGHVLLEDTALDDRNFSCPSSPISSDAEGSLTGPEVAPYRGVDAGFYVKMGGVNPVVGYVSRSESTTIGFALGLWG
eukprot:gene11605-7994_t